MKQFLLQLALSALAISPSLARADVRPAVCVTPGAGACTEWRVYTSATTVESEEHAYLSWSKAEWSSALASCKGASGTSVKSGVWPFSSSFNVSGGLCGRIFAIDNLCRSPAAGSATKAQCGKWGLIESSGVEWERIVVEASRDLFMKVSETPAISRVALVESFVDVGVNAAVKEFVGLKLGEGCANQFDSVVKTFSAPKSGLGTVGATFEAAKPIAQAIEVATTAAVAWRSAYCTVPDGIGISGPKDQAMCRQHRMNWTVEQATLMASRVISSLKSEYACDVKSR